MPCVTPSRLQFAVKNCITDTEVMFVSNTSLAVRWHAHAAETFAIFIVENYQLVNCQNDWFVAN
jgi:hypothetical protein